MSLDHPGFIDPVLDSQACFRAVLDAMARPGTVHAVTSPADPPPTLHRATAAALLTLADADTPLWLDPAAEAASDWIAFHCGAPWADRREAAFALCLGPPDLGAFSAGTDDGPEDGATLLVQVEGLGMGPGLVLEGPGLAKPRRVQVAGLGADFVAAWAANRAGFPRGVDLLLCAGDQLMALPRSIHIREG